MKDRNIYVHAPILPAYQNVNATVAAPLYIPQNVFGANDRIRAAVLGVNGRGKGHIESLMNLEKREEEIYKLRNQGATFSHIASAFSISRSRAQQLYARTKYMKEVFETLPPLRKLLSKCTQKVLDNYFKGENILENPQKIADLGWDQMLKIKNIGRKSIREVTFALYDLGFIDYEDEWLDPYRKDMVQL